MIASKRQINSSRQRYVTAITYLTKVTRYGISVITIEIEFVSRIMVLRETKNKYR